MRLVLGGGLGPGKGMGLSADVGTRRPARVPKTLPSFQ